MNLFNNPQMFIISTLREEADSLLVQKSIYWFIFPLIYHPIKLQSGLFFGYFIY